MAELLPTLAVICAVESAVTLDVATWKLPLFEPAETENDDGIITFGMSALRETDVPPLGATELSVTRQVEGAGGITESGVHEIPLTVGVEIEMVTVLPTVEVVSADPPTVEETPPESTIADEVSVVELEIVRAILATTPFEIVLELIP